MTQIVLNSGRVVTCAADLQQPTKTTVRRYIAIDSLAAQLASWRAEWLAAAGGNLQAVTLDLGMLFDDLETVLLKAREE